MQLALELLAPARNSVIGTAAIDCGADAVYIAGPAFGARAAAGNPVEDIASLCSYAHTFGARVYATVNTLLETDELAQAERLIWQYHEAGVDALIVQDMSLLKLRLPPVELHASTQSVIRTPERAVELEKAGFTRLILERQLSLDQIRAIRKAVSCDLEFFVHGALCVCYSGQCYLSEQITGRSANRGCCAQPCRSRYDLVDGDGKVLLRDKPILSLKDYRLDSRLEDLIDCGISSFKIEGRLKNASYVKNVTRHYSKLLDKFTEGHSEYRRASYGKISGGFEPNPDATFNRGYTEAWINGTRGRWNSTDAAKSMGEYVGDVLKVQGNGVTLRLRDGVRLANGDGLSFVEKEDEVKGMRAEVVNGPTVLLKDASLISQGMKVYRNLNLKFERELEKNMPKRLMKATVSYKTCNGVTELSATDEAGATVTLKVEEAAQLADKPEAAAGKLMEQLCKASGPFVFSAGEVERDKIYFYTASQVNGWRRRLGELLLACDRRQPVVVGKVPASSRLPENVKPGEGELMRTKYCIKWELGLCPKQKGPKVREPLKLINRNQQFCLHFDCKNCEMTVSL